MKRALIIFVFMVTTVMVSSIILVDTVYASQGVYGNVYAWRDGSNDCFVQGAVVKVYNNLGNYITETTASICGYYSISLGTGIYRLVVSGIYNERDVNNCGIIIDNESVAGDSWVVIISNGWNHEDIDCL